MYYIFVGLFGSITLLILVILGVTIDKAINTKWTTHTSTGKIVSLSFKEHEIHTGVGPSFGKNGGVAVTISSSPAQYNVIIRTEDLGNIVFNHDKLFSHSEVGSEVKIIYETGIWRGYDQGYRIQMVKYNNIKYTN